MTDDVPDLIFAVYIAFDHTKHGGEPNDRPDNRYLYVMAVTSLADVTFALVWGLHVGWVYKYKWTSPQSSSEYTLCVPKGVVLLQRSIRKRFLARRLKGLFHRQLTGKWPRRSVCRKRLGDCL